MNIIIFGGAFDPVHNGHINMALNAAKSLQGEVFFVPAPISVWKKESAPIEDKINMLKLAIEGKEHLHIDLFEVNSGKDINYSIDTVRYFKEKYPNDELYYLIGNDQVNQFHKWKEAELLSELAHIIYFDRPDVQVDEDNIKKYHIESIQGNGIVVSSSDIRNLKSLEIDDKVLDYILEHHLYFVKKMESYINERRLSHSIRVAQTAYKIAKVNNVENPKKIFVAALLHDIGKARNEEYERKIVEEHFPEYKNMPLFAYHQFVGAYLARKDFGIEDESMLNAIKYHATGNDSMDQLAKIVYAADKIEPGRNFDSSDLIEVMMKDVDQGFKTVLQANKEFLETHRGDINNPLTSKCFKQYL